MFQMNLILKKCMRKKLNANHEFEIKKATCHDAITAKVLKQFCESLKQSSNTEENFLSQLKLTEGNLVL